VSDGPVRIGTSLPAPAAADPLGSWTVALRARADAGLDHVMVGDHISFHVGFGMDGLALAAMVLAAEPRLAVDIGIYLLGLRHPVPTARQLATICELAPGRLTLGVGVGGEDRHEIEICGVDPATRGARLDECLHVVRQLATGEKVTFHGTHVDVTDAQILPALRPPVPLIVGGRSAAAVRRAGILGDGWLGIWASPSRYAAVVEQTAAIARDAGRPGVQWRHAMQVWCSFGDPDVAPGRLARSMERLYRTPFEKFARYSPAGSPADIAAFLRPYVDIGCRSFNLLTVGPDAATVDGAAEVRELLQR
jgi:alkanesulfonate monooxygenase SsuD/methylene tetrahydromethanopterin reductase-like flavin-dependent oxidoreductase (luciferase family)